MLYRFLIELSDIDRSVYKSLDFRVAQHPSEIAPYLLSRVLAYALSYQEGLEFASGAKLWPSDSLNFRPMKRAKLSAGPPAANGTMILTGRLG